MLKERLQRLWARLRKRYRLVLYDSESLSQSRNLNVRPLGMMLLGLGFTTLVVAGTTLLIFGTPAIRQYVPGYKNHLAEDYRVLQEKNQVLEREIAKMDTLMASLAKVTGLSNAGTEQRAMYESAQPLNALPVEDLLPPDEGGEASAAAASAVSALNIGRTVPTTRQARVFNLVPPVDGYPTMGFNIEEKNHYGIDLVADKNSMIQAVADGVVIFAEYSNTTGHVIGIWHSQYNMVSFYKHNSRLFKSVGAFVFAGEAIAVIGNTGINSSGPHLHFELWYDNQPVNPEDYIIF